jgi:hypothetical protein
MAYLGTTSTAPSVPRCVTQGITGLRTWHYTSTHISSDVSEANFFTDGLALGMKVGDQLMHFTSTGGIITSHTVLVVGSTTTDVSVGTTLGLGA